MSERVADEAVGVTVPEEHVAAFVAEAFEDVERSTTWEDVVSALVPLEARDAWESLSPAEQVVEVLAKADEYDRRAVDLLSAVPTDAGADPETVRERFAEARRVRRNADVLRDGVAAAYAEGHVDDDELVAAVERFGFDTETIAEREERLETVANVHDLDFRPYGGTLMEADDRDEGDRSDDAAVW